MSLEPVDKICWDVFHLEGLPLDLRCHWSDTHPHRPLMGCVPPWGFTFRYEVALIWYTSTQAPDGMCSTMRFYLQIWGGSDLIHIHTGPWWDVFHHEVLPLELRWLWSDTHPHRPLMGCVPPWGFTFRYEVALIWYTSTQAPDGMCSRMRFYL